MLRQYYDIKKRYPGTILFFRLGDFYEMFFEDAILGARELEITLTARQKEHGTPVPMCGVPYHAASTYIARLVRKGHRVAICEQTEDPKNASKLVKRDVVRVVTPGTTIESQLLEATKNNYLASVCGAADGMGLAVVDVSTGEFLTTQMGGLEAWEKIIEQVEIFSPSEMVYPRSLTPLVSKLRSETVTEGANEAEKKPFNGETVFTPLDDWVFGRDHAESLLRTQLGVAALDGFGEIAERHMALASAGAAIHYILETQKSQSLHISKLRYFEASQALVLDSTTITNLELLSATDGRPAHSLFGVVNQTRTGMGGRLLRQWLLRPSIDITAINLRLDAVADAMRSSHYRDGVRKSLESMGDLERLSSRLTLNRATARDLLALLESFEVIPRLKQQLAGDRPALILSLAHGLDEFKDLSTLIADSISDDAPNSASEAGMIKAGYRPELDELRELASSGKGYIAALEARERARTGIATLKVKFTNVFGYFIEVSNSNRSRVPDDYVRKQTLTNAERFTTPELKDYEGRVLGAEARILELETSIFEEIRRSLASQVRRILDVSNSIAILDVIFSFAETAARRGYTRPQVHDGDELEIKAGRHPVIESLGERFVPNDLFLNNGTHRLLVLTGPNMGGKSVYLKQAALIVLLAHAGSFVPADSAKVPITDRIFTRVGASDNLSRGRSTFMVEMIETARILNSATPQSLILLDEVGRGTSTFDGLSLAWAIAEFIHDDADHAAKTIFATHYHEMTELAKMRPGVKNSQVAVSEAGGEIVFLRKVIPGSANKSYGIEVARLAGLPESVLERAREILTNLEQNELDVTGQPKFARHLKKRSALANQPSLLDLFEQPVEDQGE